MILEPAVTVESILKTGIDNLVANAATLVPLIFAQYPKEYQDLAIAYLASEEFQPNINFQYAYDPTKMPAWNIVLSNENEAAGNNQMYLHDEVEPNDMAPIIGDYAQYGSDWNTKVNIFVRAQKDRQCLILYAFTKWLFLGNRQTLEAAGMKTPIYSGSDVLYEVDKKPTFVFTRQFVISCRVLNTVEIDISGDPTLRDIVMSWPVEVEGL